MNGVQLTKRTQILTLPHIGSARSFRGKDVPGEKNPAEAKRGAQTYRISCIAEAPMMQAARPVDIDLKSHYFNC